jgi:large subunit ribosomal protein L20
MKLARGFRGAHSRLFRMANIQVVKAHVYSFRGRKNRKRFFRKLWISRLNIWSRYQWSNLPFSSLKALLQIDHVKINFKMLAQLSAFDTLGLNFLLFALAYADPEPEEYVVEYIGAVYVPVNDLHTA